LLKFIAVSDFRCDYEKHNESCIPEAAQKKLDSIAEVTGKNVRFIADLGDSLSENIPPENAPELFKNIFYAYDRIADIHSVMGEHDFLLTKEKYLDLNDYAMRYRAFDHSDYRCIFLDSCVKDSDGNVYFEIDDEQIMWLSRLLGKSHRPAIIFTHAPIAVSDPTDEDKTIKNSSRLRELIETSNKVSLVVSGHLNHSDFVYSGNVPYITLAPMCGSDDATFAEITVSSRGVDIKGYGNQTSHTVPKTTEKVTKTTFFSKLRKIFKRK